MAKFNLKLRRNRADADFGWDAIAARTVEVYRSVR